MTRYWPTLYKDNLWALPLERGRCFQKGQLLISWGHISRIPWLFSFLVMARLPSGLCQKPGSHPALLPHCQQAVSYILPILHLKYLLNLDLGFHIHGQWHILDHHSLLLKLSQSSPCLQVLLCQQLKILFWSDSCTSWCSLMIPQV